MAEAHPDDVELQVAPGYSLKSVGLEMRTVGRLAEAMNLLELSSAIWERLANAYPAVTEFQIQQARVLNGTGMVLDSAGQLPGALAKYNAALKRLLSLREANPDQVDIQVRLGYVYNNLGGTLGRLGRNAEVLEEFRRGATVFRALADATRTSPRTGTIRYIVNYACVTLFASLVGW